MALSEKARLKAISKAEIMIAALDGLTFQEAYEAIDVVQRKVDEDRSRVVCSSYFSPDQLLPKAIHQYLLCRDEGS
ncbi:hypothetical protein [Maridesulfovibrio sp.]|uniref:hypothetical protein n=1 Tax=Maridesulfovibrio sp. TaxID=2795000 RepID=UPI003AFF8B52